MNEARDDLNELIAEVASIVDELANETLSRRDKALLRSTLGRMRRTCTNAMAALKQAE